MAGVEEVTVIGALSKDPETKYSASGVCVTRFSIPVERKVGDEYKTLWWNITCFRKTAELAGENLHKGSIVKVTGVTDVDQETMKPAIFESNGTQQTSNKLVADSVKYIANFGKAKEQEKPSGAAQDELPF